ncbi:MAG: Sapep family Mn(2+)-dependent dipeptidase [Clostridia bacterium]|nr:Sapep family Mn(2+)-dependent dipeptidase [Clostridia bacterium]
MIQDKITEYFEAHRDEMMARLAALCTIPSVQGAPEEGKPFGREVDAALEAAAAMFREEGFETERDPEGRFYLAHFGTGARTVGIFAHADVVPAGEDWSFTAPFVPVRRDGLLVARGAEDNKAGIIAALYLLKAVRELALPLDVRLVAFIGGNEETGMEDVEAFCRSYPAPDLSLVPDNDAPLSLGEKGRTEGWLVSPPLLSDILDISGGRAYNVVLDRATATLAYSEGLLSSLEGLVAGRDELTLTPKPEEGIITLEAAGRAAHASHPEGSRNACVILAETLAASDALSIDERGLMATVALYLADPYGGTLGIAGQDGPFGKRTAVSGMVRVRDGRLFLSMDIRYGSATSWRELGPILEEILADEEWDFLLGSAHDGFDLGDGDPAVSALLSAYHRITGEVEARPYYSGGGTYARCLPRAFSVGLGVPTVGAEARAVLPAGHGGAHGPDECLPEDSYLAALRVLTEYVLTAADVLRNE